MSAQILVSGGGVRNGFFWQLLAQQFPEGIARSEGIGIAPLARNSAAAGILAALMCDGVAGNLAILTGAAGGRLLGHLAPGRRPKLGARRGVDCGPDGGISAHASGGMN